MIFRRIKYNNVKTKINGIKFDSKREAKRYSELRLMAQGSLICNLELQVKYILQPKFDKNGKHYREIAYIADFVYKEKDKEGVWQSIVEDVKGMKTEIFKIKQKLFEFRYPHLTLNITK